VPGAYIAAVVQRERLHRRCPAKLKSTNPTSRRRGRLTSTNPKQKIFKKRMGKIGRRSQCLISGLTGRLTVGRNITLTLTFTCPNGTTLARTSSNNKLQTRQRGRYKITNPQLSKENHKEKEKLIAGPRWAPDTKTDWPTASRS
jgi:hypothetical protein